MGKALRVPVIAGPTASGKSDMALEIAAALGFEIVSCDSRQIYRYMDIGTAKPSAQDRDRVHHWLIDIVNPDEHYSAYRFAEDAVRIIRERASRGQRCLVCGGTGLYLKALTGGLGAQVPSDPQFRQEYQQKVREHGGHYIFRELAAVDPQSAARLHPHDVQRVIRALQVYHQTGTPLSALRTKTEAPENIDFQITVLSLPRPLLYERINCRVDTMVSRGLWDEFCALRCRGYTETDPGMLSPGYRELFAAERGELPRDRAFELVKRNTRRLAKRQITWFARQTRGIELPADGTRAVRLLGTRIQEFMQD
jgi:tRNA dimethylallyltransferase